MKKRRFLLLLAGVLMVLAGCNGDAWTSGDRVLVAKCLYEYDLKSPQRFDVVVFKYPEEPQSQGSPKNYIKRLLGLPGQILAILFGQIFCWDPQPGEPPPYDDIHDPNVNPLDLWKMPYMHVDDERSRKLFDAGAFKIVRKPPDVMMALRRIVYDNDYQARDLGVEFKRWRPAAGSQWTTDDDFREFRHSSASGEAIDWLRYQHLLRPVEPGQELKPQLITDFEAYNNFTLRDAGERMAGRNWAGDLMLECKLNVEKGEGRFFLELSKGINRFRARFDLDKGDCTFLRQGPEDKKNDSWQELDTQPTAVKRPGAYHLRFANFDARLTLWVNRDLPFGDGSPYPPPEVPDKERKETEADAQKRRGPTANDLEPASIGTQGASVSIRNIRLWRDTYYTLSPDQGVHLREADWANPDAWRELRNTGYRTMYVQPDHYLCLGDNSPASADSRTWGLVPARLMLGRALLVYFPFDRAGPIR